jgi:hypothetical protein
VLSSRYSAAPLFFFVGTAFAHSSSVLSFFYYCCLDCFAGAVWGGATTAAVFIYRWLLSMFENSPAASSPLVALSSSMALRTLTPKCPWV